jgi:hypothetical protein
MYQYTIMFQNEIIFTHFLLSGRRYLAMVACDVGVFDREFSWPGSMYEAGGLPISVVHRNQHAHSHIFGYETFGSWAGCRRVNGESAILSDHGRITLLSPYRKAVNRPNDEQFWQPSIHDDRRFRLPLSLCMTR